MADGTDAEFPPETDPDAPLTASAGDAAPDQVTGEQATDATEAGQDAAEAATPDAAEEIPDAADEADPRPAGTDARGVESGSAGAEPEASPAEDAEVDGADGEPATEAPTAVSLGLLPAEFVSAVSTQLHFYAPEITVLPARPGRERDRFGDREPEADASGPGSSRRRNRRRGGEGRDEASAPSDQPPHPRQRAVELITEPQRIKGSTRLEAKKQRRRDGREAGRRRAVVTEAEFLARREAVDRVMIVRSRNGRIQIAVLEDNVLVEHYVARSQDASLIGNVYLGRVQNVLPSMEAAFVDIGRGRNAVLYSGEVDWDAVETGNQPRRIELALKTGDRVLVQVTKDPVGHKGARLTSQISLPGRYLVYVPGGAMNGISRKLPDTERARLKKILKEVLPESSGVIVRTAAEGATEEQLTRDVQRLTNQWEHISKQIESIQAPALLHSEPDLLVKIVRDVFNEDFSKMLIQGDDAHHTISKYLESVAPDLLERVERYEGETRSVRRVPRHRADREGARPQGVAAFRGIPRHRPHGGDDRRRREHRQVRRLRRQPGGDGHQEQPGGGRRDRPPAAAARHRRHHRRGLHRHGAGVQPRPRAAPARGVPEPRPHQAPGGRSDISRSRADDPQEAGPRAARDLQ